jgi:hypothetical protein
MNNMWYSVEHEQYVVFCGALMQMLGMNVK